MECMKCGREAEAGQVFCSDCRAEMDRHPVRADVVIQLPYSRSTEGPKKSAPRRRALSDQEQIQQLRHLNRILRLCLVLAVLIACLLAFGIGILMQELEDAQNLGKNYSTVETPAVTAPPFAAD